MPDSPQIHGSVITESLCPRRDTKRQRRADKACPERSRRECPRYTRYDGHAEFQPVSIPPAFAPSPEVRLPDICFLPKAQPGALSTFRPRFDSPTLPPRPRQNDDTARRRRDARARAPIDDPIARLPRLADTAV